MWSTHYTVFTSYKIFKILHVSIRLTYNMGHVRWCAQWFCRQLTHKVSIIHLTSVCVCFWMCMCANLCFLSICTAGPLSSSCFKSVNSSLPSKTDTSTRTNTTRCAFPESYCECILLQIPLSVCVQKMRVLNSGLEIGHKDLIYLRGQLRVQLLSASNNRI